ncbi:MAG TPA: metallophosphoesterase family protein [Methanomassiliicoccales archaeon]|nr:metallophosphoesterase family protein [Methanomassiliicoccales archaeon]
MKVAFIADVHSNLEALRATLNDIDLRGITRILCAGDLVGYGANPNDVVAELRSRRVECIAGNHDRAVSRMNPVGMNAMAAAAVYWTAKNINAEAAGFLAGLKAHMQVDVEGTPLAIYHGSPRDDDEYLYEVDAVPELLEMTRSRVLVTGHTHVPYVKSAPGGHLVNPGSVGQPRDGDPRASYMVYDPGEPRFEIVRLQYDVQSAAKAITDAGLPGFLASRLIDGI